MSMKNRVLLHHSGRNQFGDPGMGPAPIYHPNAEALASMERARAEHVALNEQFLAEFGGSWLEKLEGLSKKAAWEQLCPHGKPSLSSFYSYAKECASYREFLLHWLLSHKRLGLLFLGKSKPEIKAILGSFGNCGNHGATYGQCQRFIFTR